MPTEYGTFVFDSRFARRIPDPVHHKSIGITRHILFVPAGQVPKALPYDANARVPKTSLHVYKAIEKSLLETDGSAAGTFHLKHKGITLVADRVRQRGESQYEVSISKGQGILDGGHTYELITRERTAQLPADQYVKFEILTGVPTEWISDLSGGLNTSVQVQAMSLDNLAGEFDPIKTVLKKEPYFDQIAWRENEDTPVDARDIISLMTCFNIFDFPNDRDDHPVMAYEKKSSALKLFENEKSRSSYMKLRRILKDILVLHDTILAEAPEVWNAVGSSGTGGKFGKLAFVEYREGGIPLIFTDQMVKARLMDGVLYPILAAFRWNVEIDKRTGDARWKGGFSATLIHWRRVAAELLFATVQKSEDSGRSSNSIGKSRPHWSDLHRRVAMKDLMARGAA